MSRDADPAAKVYVGDLGEGGSKPELEREFEKFGPLKSVWVARNPPGKGLCRRQSSELIKCVQQAINVGMDCVVRQGGRK